MDILQKLTLLNPISVNDKAMSNHCHPACPDTVYPIQELIPKNLTQQVNLFYLLLKYIFVISGRFSEEVS